MTFLSYCTKKADNSRTLFVALFIFIVCPSCSVSILPTEATESIHNCIPVSIMQWNIGHFSNGEKPYSTISDDSYYNKANSYKELINISNANIISINEYSVSFSNTNMHKGCSADTLLFNSYEYKFIGNNSIIRHYSLNALFSTLPLLNCCTNEYETNIDACISHTNAITAQDYYYITSRTELFGYNTLIISTHLAFDVNNPDLAIQQIKELITICEKENFVIICGDFNTSASSFELFLSAGYEIANHGFLGDFATFPANNPTKPLDNIITKGFRITNSRVIFTGLSDHLPLLCDIIPYEQ